MRLNPYAQALTKKGRPLFIPFVVLGDPDRKKSLEIIRLLVENGATSFANDSGGADALELGFPFSDPPADGPVIQAADARALRSGIRTDDCFAVLREIRAFTDIPIGLLVYYNLILQRGTEKFYCDCKESGVNSVLVADVPLEHAAEIVPVAKAHDIAPVFLVSEVTTDERMREIAKIADGYLYVVSYLGVTGVTNAVLKENIGGVIQRARKYTALPLFVGFGIATPEHAKAVVAAGGDGVIVGSRIVNELGNAAKVRRICKGIAQAM